MVPVRLVMVWLGLVLAFGVSAVYPVFGTKNEEAPVSSPANVDESSDATIPSEKSDVAVASGDANNDARTPSPELTLVEKLQARLKQLEKREQQIQDDEQRLSALRRDLEELAARQEKAIAEAVAIREAQQSSKETDQSEESLRHLIKVYEAMDPEEAALRINEMDESLALDILAGIKDKKAAGMLAGVEPKKAAKLSQGLRHYHQRKKSKP